MGEGAAGRRFCSLSPNSAGLEIRRSFLASHFVLSNSLYPTSGSKSRVQEAPSDCQISELVHFLHRRHSVGTSNLEPDILGQTLAL